MCKIFKLVSILEQFSRENNGHPHPTQAAVKKQENTGCLAWSQYIH